MASEDEGDDGNGTAPGVRMRMMGMGQPQVWPVRMRQVVLWEEVLAAGEGEPEAGPGCLSRLSSEMISQKFGESAVCT